MVAKTETVVDNFTTWHKNCSSTLKDNCYNKAVGETYRFIMYHDRRSNCFERLLNFPKFSLKNYKGYYYKVRHKKTEKRGLFCQLLRGDIERLDLGLKIKTPLRIKIKTLLINYLWWIHTVLVFVICGVWNFRPHRIEKQVQRVWLKRHTAIKKFLWCFSSKPLNKLGARRHVCVLLALWHRVAIRFRGDTSKETCWRQPLPTLS